MKRVQLTATGKYSDKSNLSYSERAELPVLQAEDEVLVQVEACGVCYRDIIDREGGNSFLSPPISLGHEIAGKIVKVFSNTTKWAVCDRVVSLHGPQCGKCEYCIRGDNPRCLSNPTYMYGLTHDGGYQQVVSMHVDSIVKLPEFITFQEGSFLNCTAAVALRGLKYHGHLKKGDTVLITGASGGVGVHAVQIVKAYGAKAVCVTSSPSKISILESLGADKVIVSSKNSFHSEVISEVGKVDIALELVGEPTLVSSMRCLKPTAVCVVIGNISVTKVSISLGAMILFENKLVGSSGATKADLEEIFDLIKEKKLKPVLHSEYPLSIDGVQAAHSLLKQQNVIGRVVLRSAL